MRYAIALIIFFISAVTSCSRGLVCTACQEIQDSTIPLNVNYYNLSGKLVKKGADPIIEQRIVLSRKSSPKFVDQFIGLGYTIKVPTEEILKKLYSCSKMSDDSDYEHGFVVGKLDTVSIIVKGLRRSLDTDDRRKYFTDLALKKDSPAYDVHAHPRFKDTTEGRTIFGNAQASPEDRTSYDIKEFNHNWKYIQPSIVLGYEPDVSTKWQDGLYHDYPVQTIRYIGFYNYCNSRIDTMQFDKFMTLVRSISTRFK